MFLAIAIVCDEFFVPCLEYIADDFQLSKDIAGATLMAAGGSAPELFMSGYGTLTKSTVGFSTIVGSAVFNVIFVIGVCALAAPGDLQLTWWPLFRDCTYYVLTLTTLAVFMVDGKIELWESIVQFVMYFGYVAMMSKSEALEKFKGGVVLVSHDAKLISELECDLYICDNKKITKYDGDFEDYKEKIIQETN